MCAGKSGLDANGVKSILNEACTIIIANREFHANEPGGGLQSPPSSLWQYNATMMCAVLA